MTGGGTYTLVLNRTEEMSLVVGALGAYTFEAGWYAYVGSALGPGGFSRIDRHREIAAGEREVRHWHIDYLLGHSNTTFESAVRTPDCDGECEIATQLREACQNETVADGMPIPQFGCTDCSCNSHLFFASDGDSLRQAVQVAHENVQ